MSAVLAIDIGGTKTACALVHDSGEVENRGQVPTVRAADEAIENAIRLAAEVDPDKIAIAVGISTCGVVDPGSGRITGATELIPDWLGADVRGRIQRELDLPVACINDVQAHALGEFLAGAAAGYRSALVVAVGTGLGAGFITDHGVWRGARGAMGHLGHTYSAAARGIRCACGQDAHLESIASGSGLPVLYRTLGGTKEVDSAEDVIRRAATDELARHAIEIAAGELGRAIGSACNFLDPEVIVLSGGMRNPSAQWSDCLEKAMREVLMPVLADIPLLQAGLGDDAPLIGVAYLARNESLAHA